MTKKRASKKSSSAKRRRTGVTTTTKKLGDESLNWITDTSKAEENVVEQAESSKSLEDGESNEKKIGILKQYVSLEAEKMKDDTPEVIPLIPNNSFTIMKGNRGTTEKDDEVKKSEMLESEETTAEKEATRILTDFTETAVEKKDDFHSEEIDNEIVPKQDKESKVKTGKTKDTVEKGVEKTGFAVEIPIEFGKSYVITERKKLAPAEEGVKSTPAKKETARKAAELSLNSKAEETKITEKNKVKDEEKTAASRKKETEPKDVEPPPDYEVKKEGLTAQEEAKIEESIVYIPEDSSSIVKKRGAVKKETIEKKEKVSLQKKKAAKIIIGAEAIPSGKREKSRTSKIVVALKKGGKEIPQKIAASFKSVKPGIKKTVGVAFNVSRHPVKALSDVDHKITQSMKKVASFDNSENAEKSILKNIKSTDNTITKSVKKLLDSILK